MLTRSNGSDPRPAWRRPKTWLLTAAVAVMPFAGVVLAAYGLGRLVLRRRPAPVPDAYQEWLMLRDLIRSRRQQADGHQTSDTTLRRP